MRKTALWLAAPAMLVLAACGGNDDDNAQLDNALRNDLSLAAQAQPFPAQQFVSPYEMGYGPQGQPMHPQYPMPYPPPGGYYPQQQPQYGYPQPVPVVQRAPAPVVQRAPARTTSTAGRTQAEPIRNTKRDAVLGAATSRDKLKGAVIGATAGGVLGAIVGHTIDIKNP